MSSTTSIAWMLLQMSLLVLPLLGGAVRVFDVDRASNTRFPVYPGWKWDEHADNEGSEPLSSSMRYGPYIHGTGFAAIIGALQCSQGFLLGGRYVPKPFLQTGEQYSGYLELGIGGFKVSVMEASNWDKVIRETVVSSDRRSSTSLDLFQWNQSIATARRYGNNGFSSDEFRSRVVIFGDAWEEANPAHEYRRHPEVVDGDDEQLEPGELKVAEFRIRAVFLLDDDVDVAAYTSLVDTWLEKTVPNLEKMGKDIRELEARLVTVVSTEEASRPTSKEIIKSEIKSLQQQLHRAQHRAHSIPVFSFLQWQELLQKISAMQKSLGYLGLGRVLEPDWKGYRSWKKEGYLTGEQLYPGVTVKTLLEKLANHGSLYPEEMVKRTAVFKELLERTNS